MRTLDNHPKLLICALFFILSAALSGCSTPYSPPLIKDNKTFKGLEDYLNESTNGHLTIIAAHGMCHHNLSWAQTKSRQVSNLMGMEIRLPQMSENFLIPVGGPHNGNNIVAFRTDMSRNLDNKSITLYSLLYSGPSDEEKESLCFDVNKPTAICSGNDGYDLERAWLNETLKNELLNDCLADAVFYLGDNGYKVKDGVKGY